MKVLLIGKTEVDLFPARGDSRHVMPGKAEGSNFEKRLKKDHPYSLETGQELIEFAGRLCYEAWEMLNPQTANNSGYIRNIVDHGHFSVLEHVSVTLYVEGVSRNLSHELIRHRHLSFSELSQRYVDMKSARFVTPPALGGTVTPLSGDDVETYEAAMDALEFKGYTGKAARQAARYFLPGGTETKFVVTGNLRAWRDVLAKRWSVHADVEMQEFAGQVYDILETQYPDVFADMKYEED